MTERERDRERGWGNGEGKGWRGENKRPFKDQNTPRWRALAFEWRDLQGGRGRKVAADTKTRPT